MSMIAKGVLTQVSWMKLSEEILKGKIATPSVPEIEITNLRDKSTQTFELDVGNEINLFVYPNLYCTFRKPDGTVCLNVIEKTKDKLPICNICRLEIPSTKCLMGEPQCLEKEAPKTAKCVKSGVYKSRCIVPRYHYLLIYPVNTHSVYLKVGIQRETTFPTRILEQGSIVSVVYAKTPNIWKGRYVEVASRDFLAKYEEKSIVGLKVYHVSEKKKSLSKIEDVVKFIRGTTSSLEMFLPVATSEKLIDKALELGKQLGEELAREFKEFALERIIVLDNLKIYKHDKNMVKRATSIQEVPIPSSELRLSGKVAGWLGSFLLLFKERKLLILDMRRLLGRLMTIEVVR